MIKIINWLSFVRISLINVPFRLSFEYINNKWFWLCQQMLEFYLALTFIPFVTAIFFFPLTQNYSSRLSMNFPLAFIMRTMSKLKIEAVREWEKEYKKLEKWKSKKFFGPKTLFDTSSMCMYAVVENCILSFFQELFETGLFTLRSVDSLSYLSIYLKLKEEK